ncbi:MAG: phosphoribosylformylglycinamidine cyclo-ligase [Planctomycetes bacterium]|nr:phosphoribosylformylglycinamidine cyclo-ligase [Planctomycetota bacterium]
MKTAVRSTYGREVLSELGTFAGLFDASVLKEMSSPVLVSSTDSVGTKTKVAARAGRWDTIGQDIVNHCVNDILVGGARPLFFLDYVASSRLEPEVIAAIVGGAAEACREAGCALIGGETAEMPGVYHTGEVDLVGTVVGVVDRDKIIDGKSVQCGDVILALSSTGLHTNGYSLANQALADLDWDGEIAELGGSVADALLAVHRSYLKPIQALWEGGVKTRALAHITGGGVVDNLPRVLPEGVRAKIRAGSWPEPPIFSYIQERSDVSESEMYQVFNRGLGMLAVISSSEVDDARAILGDDIYLVGEIQAGDREVVIE